MISPEEGTNELAFLESVFQKLHNFEQVNVAISFQQYDPDLEEFVDLGEDDELRNLEKLNVVVTPVLVILPEVSQVTTCVFNMPNNYYTNVVHVITLYHIYHASGMPYTSPMISCAFASCAPASLIMPSCTLISHADNVHVTGAYSV